MPLWPSITASLSASLSACCVVFVRRATASLSASLSACCVSFVRRVLKRLLWYGRARSSSFVLVDSFVLAYCSTAPTALLLYCSTASTASTAPLLYCLFNRMLCCERNTAGASRVSRNSCQHTSAYASVTPQALHEFQETRVSIRQHTRA